MIGSGLSKPPEGAVVGESVPRENEEEDMREAEVQRLVGVLKTRPEYHGRSDAELEEIARKKLRKLKE